MKNEAAATSHQYHDARVQINMNIVLLSYVTCARGFPVCTVKGREAS